MSLPPPSPQDKYWLRANFLVQTCVYKPCRNGKRLTRSAANHRSGALTSNQDYPPPATPRSGRGAGRVGGRPKRADPDYDPAADEGWRVGIPCSANRRSGRNTTAKRYISDPEEEDDEDAEDDDDDGFGEEEMSGITQKEEWISEEAAYGISLWQIRHFFDT